MIQQGDFTGASQHFERVVRLDDLNSNAWEKLGYSYFKLRKFKHSLSAYQRAMALSPQSPLVWYGLGVYFLTVNQFSLAEIHFMLSLQDNVPFGFESEANYHLGLISIDKGLFERAVNHFRSACIGQDKPIQSLVQIGQCYEHLSRLEDAISTYEEAAVLSPNNYKIMEYKGWAFFLNKQHEESINLFDSALELTSDPSEVADLFYLKGRAYLEVKNFQEAKEAFQMAIRKKANASIYWCSAGIMYALAMQAHDALNCLMHASHLDPENALIWANMGILYEMSKQYSDASRAYQKALCFDYGNMEIKQLLDDISEDREVPEFMHPLVMISDVSFVDDCNWIGTFENLETEGSTDGDSDNEAEEDPLMFHETVIVFLYYLVSAVCGVYKQDSSHVVDGNTEAN